MQVSARLLFLHKDFFGDAKRGDILSKEITLKVKYSEKRKLKTKEFLIQIVPNRFNVDYPKYFAKLQKVIVLNEELKGATKAELIKGIETELLDLNLQKILDMKYNLIKTLLIANDYEVDIDWWDTRVDPLDIEDFIAACFMKDNEEVVKKKLLRLR